jgi:hypothetical protein
VPAAPYPLGVNASRAIAVTATTLALLAGCTPEERIVNYKPFFSGIKDAQTQTPAVAERRDDAPAMPGGEMDPAAVEDPAKAAEHQLLQKDKKGNVSIIARSGTQLMYHIQKCLEDEDPNLFASQVLCKATRQDYIDRGLDPRDAYKTCKAAERQIAILFNRMPMGEHSPNVLLEQLGANTFRVKITGKAAADLERWVGFDMVFENGNYRLRWFVSRG